MKLPWSRVSEQQALESDLEGAKRKLKLLKFERDMLSQMILKVYESRDIDEEDRKYLLEKYKASLKDIESSINTYSAIVEVRELENAREELINLFNSKMSQIDRRINELNKMLGELSSRRAQVPEGQQLKEPLKEKKEEKKERPREDKGEKEEKEEDRLEELYKEVNSVLEKLEQIDVG